MLLYLLVYNTHPYFWIAKLKNQVFMYNMLVTVMTQTC
jgi:hypothetical protein